MRVPAEDLTQLSPVLWLMEGSEGYGVRQSSYTLMHELEAQRIESVIICLSPAEAFQDMTSRNMRVLALGMAKGRPVGAKGLRFAIQVAVRLAQSFKAIGQLRAQIRSAKPRWIYVQFNALMPLAGVAGRLTSTPVVWLLPNRVNDKLPFKLQPLLYQAISRLLRVTPVANSDYTARSLGRSLTGVAVAYPGVDQDYFDPSRFDRAAERERLGLDVDDIVFLVAARLVSDKAQDLVLEAFASLAQATPNLRLLFAGGPLESKFSRQLLHQSITNFAPNSVRFLGAVSDVRPLLTACDVLINSRRNAEPFGVAIIEAMMMQRPVIAYALGGPSETIVDGETGWLVPEPTVEAYGEGLARALRDIERWRTMGARARAHAIDNFSADAFAQGILANAQKAVLSKGAN